MISGSRRISYIRQKPIPPTHKPQKKRLISGTTLKQKTSLPRRYHKKEQKDGTDWKISAADNKELMSRTYEELLQIRKSQTAIFKKMVKGQMAEKETQMANKYMETLNFTRKTQIKNNDIGQAQWLTPAIPTLWEAET